MLPISAVLALGGIAGQGSYMAQQRAQQMQNDQMAMAVQKQNQEAQQQADQLQAQKEANRIQTALQYNQMNEQQQQRQNEQAQQQAQENAKMMMDQSQFNQRQGLDVQEQQFKQKEVTQKATDADTQKASVHQLIDTIYQPGTPENQRAKLEFEANGKVPAPASPNLARNLNAVNAQMKMMFDPLTQAPIQGKEAEYASLNQTAQAIVKEMVSNGIVPNVSGAGTATAPSAQPAQQQAPPNVQLTGQQSSDGFPIAVVNGMPMRFVQSPDQLANIRSGTQYVGPDGIPAVRR